MKNVPTASVDMILCDLPYGTTQNKWDVIIPFDKLWLIYKRVIKPNGAIVLNASEPFTSLLISSNTEMYRYSWIWIKNTPTGFINAHQQPLKLYEDICVFSNAGVSPSSKNKMTYNPQGLTDFGKITKRGSAGKNYNSVSTENYQEKSNYPRNVLTFPKDSKKLHPTQKPVALLEYLIRTYTNEGDIVLDNCMGSGSTGVAALNTNRRFIGIELDTTYCGIARQRILDIDSNIT